MHGRSPQKRKGSMDFGEDIEKGIVEDVEMKKNNANGETGVKISWFYAALAIIIILLYFLNSMNIHDEAAIMSMEKFQQVHKDFLKTPGEIEKIRNFEASAEPVKQKTSSTEKKKDYLESYLTPSRIEKEYKAPSSTVHSENGVDVKHDIREILSVSAVIILLDGEADEEEQNEFLNIMLNFVSINPEPRVVNLEKHPHCEEIKKYLKEFYSNSASNSPSSPYGKGDNDNFPRLFIGGHPFGGFSEIIDKYNANELVAYLQSSGKGLINVTA